MHLRRRESVIDDETERAVAGWVRLGDQLTGRQTADERASCARCGSTDRVLDRGQQALCARCYLERGDPANKTSDIGAMELYAASVIAADPFRLADALRT